MAHGYYAEINLHIVWHTKHNQPFLTPVVEPIVYGLLRKKALDWPGVLFHEVGGIENHVHVALSIPPTISICDLVGQMKGFSAHQANKMVGQSQPALVWQTGYGVVSFGTRELPWVRNYILNQKEHHRNGLTQERLENSSEDEKG